MPRLWLAAITVAHVGYCEMTQHTVLRAEPIRNTSGLYACVLTQGRDTCATVGPRTPGTSRDACEASCHPAPPPPVPPPPPLPSTCGLKPGAPVTYKQLCSAAQNKTACDALSLTCKWVSAAAALAARRALAVRIFRSCSRPLTQLTVHQGPAPPIHGMNYTCEGAMCVPDPGGNFSDGNCSHACAIPPPPPPPRPPGCDVRPGAPAGYKALCAAATNQPDCAKLNITCTWVPPPSFACVILNGSGGGYQCLELVWEHPHRSGTANHSLCESYCVAPPPPACNLKPGVPPVYKQVCDLAHNQTACARDNLTCTWGPGPPLPPPPPPPPAPPPPPPPPAMNYTCEASACILDPGGKYTDGNCSNACKVPPPPPPPPVPGPPPCPQPPKQHNGRYAECTTKDSNWADCYCASADPLSWPPTWSSMQNGRENGLFVCAVGIRCVNHR